MTSHKIVLTLVSHVKTKREIFSNLGPSQNISTLIINVTQVKLKVLIVIHHFQKQDVVTVWLS